MEEERHLIDDNIIQEAIEKYKKEQEQSNPEDLKQFVDESTRIRLSEEDLKKIEEVLLNPPKPNEKLKEAAKRYNETIVETPIDETPIEENPTEVINDVVEEKIEEVTNQPIVEKETFTEKTQLQKLEEYVNPAQEPTIEEEEQNFSSIEPTPEFEIPEQEGWTEEMEQQFWEEQPIEPFATPEEVEKFQIDAKTIDNTLNQVNEEIDNQPQPTQTISVVIDENDLKPFDVDLQIEQPQEEPNKPSFEVTAEKKNL